MTMTAKLSLLSKYQGTVVQRPGQHLYKNGNPNTTCYMIDGVKHKRVTTVLEKTIPKPALIDWARNVALRKAKAQLLDLNPFILLRTDDSTKTENNELWYQFVSETIEAARNRPDEVKDEAANWGTRAHHTIEQYILAGLGSLIVYDVPDEFAPAIKAFEEFTASHNIEWLATEMVVWDSDLAVAGTVDAIGWSSAISKPCPTCTPNPTALKKNCSQCAGEGTIKTAGYVICDWKTGKGHYPEMALQLSAYAAMFTKLTGNPVAEGYVVRFPKEQPEADNPTFDARKVADLDHGWRLYQNLVPQAAYLDSKPWEE